MDDESLHLTFRLDGQSFALDVGDVTEIIEWRRPTTVPAAPDHVLGVLNLRGRAVPVIDLSVRLGREATVVGRRTAIVIVRPPGGAEDDSSIGYGLVVDAVNEVARFGPDDLAPVPVFGTVDAGRSPARAMARTEDGFVVVLDAARLVAESERDALSRLAAFLTAGEEADDDRPDPPAVHPAA